MFACQLPDVVHYRDIQVQLRFCLLETSCEQQDKFPSGIGVRINNKPAQLPVCFLIALFNGFVHIILLALSRFVEIWNEILLGVIYLSVIIIIIIEFL